MAPKPEAWIPRGVIFEFYHGWYIVAILDSRACAPDTDVTEDSYSDCLFTAGHENKKKVLT